MSNPSKELLLADLAVLKLKGRGVIFLRPRWAMPDDELAEINNSHLAQCTPGYVWITVPHQFDIMVAGDAEMEKLGWMRIPAPKTAQEIDALMESPTNPDWQATSRPVEPLTAEHVQKLKQAIYDAPRDPVLLPDGSLA